MTEPPDLDVADHFMQWTDPIEVLCRCQYTNITAWTNLNQFQPGDNFPERLGREKPLSVHICYDVCPARDSAVTGVDRSIWTRQGMVHQLSRPESGIAPLKRLFATISIPLVCGVSVAGERDAGCLIFWDHRRKHVSKGWWAASCKSRGGQLSGNVFTGPLKVNEKRP